MRVRLPLDWGCDADAKRLTIVIPTYNEAQRIVFTLDSLCAYFADDSFEIILADDGSSDETALLAAGKPAVRVLSLGRHRGKGAAVKAGILAARGAWILVCDADLSIPIDAIERLAAALEAGNAELAIGSKALPVFEGAAPRRALHRVLMSKAFNLIVRATLLPALRDTQCGFKLFRRDAAQAVFSQVSIDGFGFDVEALYIARQMGYRIVEVGVPCNRGDGTSVRVWRDSVRALLDVAQIAFRHHFPTN